MDKILITAFAVWLTFLRFLPTPFVSIAYYVSLEHDDLFFSQIQNNLDRITHSHRDQTRYVLLQVFETNRDDGLTAGFSMKPQILFTTDEAEQLLRVTNKFLKPTKSTLLFLGHTINFNGKSRQGTMQKAVLVDSLPYVEKASNFISVGSAQAVHFAQDLQIVKMDEHGSLFLKFGKTAFFLKPAESWSTRSSKKLNAQYYSTQIIIKNFGWWEKLRVEVPGE